MISFFRKIRQKLLSQNRVTRYLVYALGEVILVTIGILIALSINTWNEDRKDRIYEQKMLTEIYRSLVDDADYIRNHLLGYRIESVDASIKYFDQLLLEQKPDSSKLSHFFERLSWGLTFQINEGPYEGLKANGLDRVSNDTLRNTLMWYFDFAIPRYEELVEWNINRFQKDMMEISSEYKGDYKIKEQNGEIILYQSLTDTQFIHEPKFLRLLAYSKTSNSWNKSRFNELLQDQLKLMRMLEMELDLNPNNQQPK